MEQGTSSLKKVFGIITMLLLAIGIVTSYFAYKIILKPNVHLSAKQDGVIYIPTGATIKVVNNLFKEKNVLKDRVTFAFLAKILKYDSNIRPGKYTLIEGMNNKDLIILLKSGRQTPVRITFNNVRTKEQLAGIISRQLEIDSIQLKQELDKDEFLKTIGFNSYSVAAMFIPNTYEFYWNTSTEKFLSRMKKEYDEFWNDERRSLAMSLQLRPIEVSILASIVEQETNSNEEKSIIAGVYLNRLHKKWKLEADPTLVYACGNFSIRRVLNEHKEIDSPYNTYKKEGLPPGPICIPSVSSIDAVLHSKPHTYMFFCAKDDFSGFHNFATSYSEQMINARKFQKALNRRKIMN